MNNQATVQVWDILIRLFHWSLVVAFTVAYLTGEEENSWHIYSGYLVLGLIIFRIVWGLIGSKHARFSDFIYSPTTVIDYVKQLRSGNARHYLGHNPIGGWMVLALLATLLLVTISGLKVYAIEEGQGPFASSSANLAPIAAAYAEEEQNDSDDEADEEFWEEIHEASSNFMLLLIVAHVLGVVIAGRVHKENLVKAMFTGKKQLP
jgi:cytochrome b